ncbi:hypothetical protein [Neobacillus niacini]|uniref:hypothetical protein n=1 Tax=Neobacillus niacini TaxID=86668 RepID=UPI0021CB1DFD|nr:hypothetical protein [Neobacillus niacini]MCM3768745.1 hypothetical protein [Neobacillus niacini]
MFALKRMEASEEDSVKLVAYTIILYISSFFVPFIVVAAYQSLVYYSRSQWFFATPFSAYVAFMGGMLYIAALLTVYLILRQKWEGAKLKLKLVIGVFAVLSIPVFLLSLTNYYYVDDKGIHYNQLISFQEAEYKWEKIETVNVIYRNQQGTTSYYQYKFELANGSTVTLPYNGKFNENRWRINAKIEQYQIKEKDNFDNPIMD